MSQTVLLTGATGFVGRQILNSLVERGMSIRAVVRTGKQDSLGRDVPTVTTPDLFAESVAWCAQTCAGIDTVVHAAWYAEPGFSHSERMIGMPVREHSRTAL